jgi:hypothetical protein
MAFLDRLELTRMVIKDKNENRLHLAKNLKKFFHSYDLGHKGKKIQHLFQFFSLHDLRNLLTRSKKGKNSPISVTSVLKSKRFKILYSIL